VDLRVALEQGVVGGGKGRESGPGALVVSLVLFIDGENVDQQQHLVGARHHDPGALHAHRSAPCGHASDPLDGVNAAGVRVQEPVTIGEVRTARRGLRVAHVFAEALVTRFARA
jgi:hypothetical protein